MTPDKLKNTAATPLDHSDAEAEQLPEDDTPSADTRARRKEIGGRDGPDPTRYGDWEKNGRCIDF